MDEFRNLSKGTRLLIDWAIRYLLLAGTSFTGAEHLDVNGSSGTDYIRVGSLSGVGNTTINSQAGNDGGDYIYGGNGDDWIFGRDYWTYGDAADQFFGEAGYDYVFHYSWVEVG